MITIFAVQIACKGIGSVKYEYVQFKPGLEDFDIEQTCENISSNNQLNYNDIVSIEKSNRKSAVIFILDISNSMQMEKIVAAAVAIGVLAIKLKDDYHSVIAFKDDPQIIKNMREELTTETLIDRILDLKPGGCTDIRQALEKGLEVLNDINIQDRIGIIITDGWVTRGGDPIEIAKKYTKLHVIQVPLGIGGGDFQVCKNIAKAGRGKYSYIHDFQKLPRALNTILR
jgi:Mg-chelatase subunit ChlD